VANEDEIKPNADSQKRDGPAITDYLVSPKKKRRQYVVLLLSERFNLDLKRAIIRFIKETYPGLSVAEPKSLLDFRRQFIRKIHIVIVDDEFDDIDKTMLLIDDLKVRKKNEAVPCLFLTRQPDNLLKSYHQHLAAYHEVDEFCHYLKVKPHQLLSRIKVGIEQNNRRRSRRYNVFIPIYFYHLSNNNQQPAAITDLSAHGAKIEADDEDFQFRQGDQLKLSIPVSEFFPPKDGDFLRLSAKVRRVFMAGNSAGISFEHVSDPQFLGLARILNILTTRSQRKPR